MWRKNFVWSRGGDLGLAPDRDGREVGHADPPGERPERRPGRRCRTRSGRRRCRTRVIIGPSSDLSWAVSGAAPDRRLVEVGDHQHRLDHARRPLVVVGPVAVEAAVARSAPRTRCRRRACPCSAIADSMCGRQSSSSGLLVPGTRHWVPGSVAGGVAVAAAPAWPVVPIRAAVAAAMATADGERRTRRSFARTLGRGTPPLFRVRGTSRGSIRRRRRRVGDRGPRSCRGPLRRVARPGSGQLVRPYCYQREPP